MATYQGRTVKLNKPMKGDVKKFKVFVKDGDKVKKINFGDPNMSIKKNSPARKKSYCARSGGIKEKIINYLQIIGLVKCGIVKGVKYAIRKRNIRKECR